MAMKVLITPRSFAQEDPRPLVMLQEAGFEIVRNSYPRPLTEGELCELAADTRGIIVGVDKITAKVIEKAKNLKIISKYGVGTDNIDLAAATKKGILVTYTPGANTTAVAEFTIGLMFAVARRIPYADRLVRERKWVTVMGRELYGKVLGVVGLGRIGREVAQRAHSLGMRVIAFDIKPDFEFAEHYSIQYVELEALLTDADFLSIHVPLTPATHRLIGEAELKKMKPGAFLINTSRGGIVDEQALLRALREGWIAGAALDVFSQEPLTNEELRGLPNVVVTPHIAAHTMEAVTNMGCQAVKNLIDGLRGTIDPEVVVNQDVLVGWGKT